MSEGEESVEEVRVCGQCHRPLQQTIFDTCFFCGAPIAEEQQLDEAEKQRLKEALEAQRLGRKKHETARAEMQQSRSKVQMVKRMFRRGR